MFKFQSKSSTLDFLNKKKFNINKFISFSKLDIQQNKKWAIFLLDKFKNKKIIIRSSASDEDQLNTSNAGKYDSFILKKLSEKSLDTAVKKIIKKFKYNNDRIIFQEYLEKPDMSGVIFTRDINNLAPYYVFNYDLSGKTNLITGGKKNISQKTIIIHRDYNKVPHKFKKLLVICKKLEKVLRSDSLDIEFGVKKNRIYIFQVRPISNFKKTSDKIINSILTNIEKKIIKLQKKSPIIDGSTTIFSNMSDWNPAEMIGSTSDNLAISMYEELITDNIWAKQRSKYGYKIVNFNPLMVTFAFSPYIDIRVDLNSFLPNKISKKLQIKTLNYLIKKLKKNPEQHDKIEFNLIPTCNSKDLNYRLSKFLKKDEVKKYGDILIDLTNNILVEKKTNPFLKDINDIMYLKKKLEDKKFYKSHPIQNIYFLVQLCKNYGTLPFSGIARTAFITTSLLKDLVSTGALTEERISSFYKNIKSFSFDFNNDLNKFNKKKITKNNFLKKYGHLRPNTYSIVSPNYAEGFSNYFGNLKNIQNNFSKRKFKLSKIEKKRINSFLKKIKVDINSTQLFEIAEKSIYFREYSKYIFSKGIDKIFSNLLQLGNELKITREDLQFLSIKTILNSYNNLSPLKLAEIIKNEILQNKKLFKQAKAIKLPDVISSYKDIYFFTQDNSKENFITNNKVSSGIFTISNSLDKIDFKKLNNKIILIKNADPGFDFIFSHNIKGLITQYGGVNSHMAIRCMENNIPAAIGIGEKKFNFFKYCKKIELNCQSKKITKLI